MHCIEYFDALYTPRYHSTENVTHLYVYSNFEKRHTLSFKLLKWTLTTL